MTLRDRFAKATNKGSYYVIPIFEDAEIIEQIADEFAIEFAKWIQFHSELWINHSTKELLEIYKKEKGL
jgi:hypothetical protein